MRTTLQKYMPVVLGLEEATGLSVEEIPTTDNPEQPATAEPMIDKPVVPLASEPGPVELVIGRNGDGMDFVKPEQTQAEIEAAVQAQPPLNSNPDMRLPTSEEPEPGTEPLPEPESPAVSDANAVTEPAVPVEPAVEPAVETPPVEEQEEPEPVVETPPVVEEEPEVKDTPKDEEEEEEEELDKPKVATEQYRQPPVVGSALNKWITENVSAEEFPNTGDRSHLSVQTLIDVPLDHQPNVADPVPEVVPEVPSTEDVSTDESLDHAMVAQDAIADEMTQMEDVGVAIEGYIELMTSARAAGGITPREAGFMRLGLSMLENKLGVRALTPGLEAYTGPASIEHSTTVSLEVLTGVVKDVYKALQLIWRELRIYLGTAWNELTNGVGRLVTDAKELQATVATLQGVPNQGEFEITGTQLAFANGHFVGQDPVVIAGLTAYISQEYPKELKNWLNGLTTALASVKFLSFESIDRAIKAVVEMGSHTTGQHRIANQFRGDHFPGNYWLTTSDDIPAFAAPKQHFAAMGKAVKFKVNAPLPNGLRKVVEPPSRYTVKVGTPAELKRRAADIVKIIDTLNTVRNSTIDLGRELDRLEKASEEAAQIAAAVSQTTATPPNLHLLIELINGCTRAARMGTTNFNQVYYYVVRVLKTNMAILKQEVAQYQ